MNFGFVKEMEMAVLTVYDTFPPELLKDGLTWFTGHLLPHLRATQSSQVRAGSWVAGSACRLMRGELRRREGGR